MATTHCENCQNVEKYYQDWIRADKERRESAEKCLTLFYVIATILLITGAFGGIGIGSNQSETTQIVCQVLFWLTIGCVVGYVLISIYFVLKRVFTPMPDVNVLSDVENPM